MARVQAQVRMDPNLKETLEDAAKARNRTFSGLVESICLSWAKRHPPKVEKEETTGASDSG